MRAAREAWCEAQPELDPDRLVFLDETSAATNMARRHDWAARGERCRLAAPLGHYTTTITPPRATPGLSATALFLPLERFRFGLSRLGGVHAARGG